MTSGARVNTSCPPKVLILGASGLLGHTLLSTLAPRSRAAGTIRNPASAKAMSAQAQIHFGVDGNDFGSVERAFESFEPSVVVNCIGVVKKRVDKLSVGETAYVNGEFPHRLAQLCETRGIRMIHISTDCVFSGKEGNYSEKHSPDPVDTYGQSKSRGEPSSPVCLTLRTSFIGRELGTANGLLEWFMAQRGNTVRGFRRAIFSGMTTLVLSRLIVNLIQEFPDLNGTWHVAADPIDKFSLLSLVNRALELDITIEPDDSVVCDRSLDGSRFRARTGFIAPSWPEMVAELARQVDVRGQGES